MPKKKNGNQKKEIVEEYPDVCILTPIYNRNKWLPMMMANLATFDYDKKKMTWFILDSKDGDEDIRLFDEKTLQETKDALKPIRIKYQYIPRKMTIAEKRTYLSKNMTGKYFANMDSDDIYMESYLKYSLDLLREKKVGLVGSAEMIFIYPHYDYKVTAIRCEAKRQIHEATMVGTKNYIRSMGYFSKKEEKGEGASIIDGNENNVEKSECGNCMICVCHNTNTCSKELFKEVNVQDITIKGTKKDVLDFIMKDEITDGFEDLAQFQKED
tara:strand:- start:2031 stop:2840 length:810 start_codon:yes stop_codon:yes gene_type:complete